MAPPTPSLLKVRKEKRAPIGWNPKGGRSGRHRPAAPGAAKSSGPGAGRQGGGGSRERGWERRFHRLEGDPSRAARAAGAAVSFAPRHPRPKRWRLNCLRRWGRGARSPFTRRRSGPRGRAAPRGREGRGGKKLGGKGPTHPRLRGSRSSVPGLRSSGRARMPPQAGAGVQRLRLPPRSPLHPRHRRGCSLRPLRPRPPLPRPASVASSEAVAASRRLSAPPPRRRAP